MENYVSKLIRSYLETRNEYYYERLQEQFLPLIKAYARKLYYLNYEDSQQELCIALYESISKIKNTDNEFACISYIKRSIVNKFTKLYHESVKEQNIQANSTSLVFNANLGIQNDGEVENCITMTDLKNYLQKKTLEERKIIDMLIQGYSDKEIGREMGFTRQYINRIKKQILK